MIKRSIPTTFSAFCEDANYAQGMKDGITHTLECLLHECDVIMRISPYVVQLTTEEPDNDKIHKYQVRARFTVREKRPGKTQGAWIKIDRAFYEEEFDDKFDTDREWKGLTDEELRNIIGISSADSDWNVLKVINWAKAIEAKLREKNHEL